MRHGSRAWHAPCGTQPRRCCLVAAVSQSAVCGQGLAIYVQSAASVAEGPERGACCLEAPRQGMARGNLLEHGAHRTRAAAAYWYGGLSVVRAVRGHSRAVAVFCSRASDVARAVRVVWSSPSGGRVWEAERVGFLFGWFGVRKAPFLAKFARSAHFGFALYACLLQKGAHSARKWPFCAWFTAFEKRKVRTAANSGQQARIYHLSWR